MHTEQKQLDWNDRVMSFNAENAGRPTRLGVLEPSNGSVDDYWLEDGLPLRGVTFSEHDGRVSAQILLDGFTHTVANADRIELIYGSNELDVGLNVVDLDGRTSLLRFE